MPNFYGKDKNNAISRLVLDVVLCLNILLKVSNTRMMCEALAVILD